MELMRKYVDMLQKDLKIIMSKRCGLDELNNFIMLIGFVLVLVSLFTGRSIFTLLGAGFVVLCYLRVFSTNITSRKRENAFYMRYMGSVVNLVNYGKLIVKMKIKSIRDKEYIYFVCSGCRQIIRLPKGKNKISVRCPKCGASYIKRT